MAAARRGASITVTALTSDEADKVVAEIGRVGGRAMGFVCDVTSAASIGAAIEATMARFGRLDAVVHNATSRFSPLSAPIEDVTEEQWDDLVAVSVRGTFLIAAKAREALEISKGSLLLLTSNAAYHGAAEMPAYTAVKGAQRGMVKAMAREWGPLGIRVNGLAPVAMTPAMVHYLELNPDAREPLLARSALRRFGDPETDIGAAASFLIGPDAGFVTGQNLVVDGGGMMP